MTCIVDPKAFKSKAHLKECLDKGTDLHEPSIMGSWTKNSKDLPIGFQDIVTNHPQRSKFAKIVKRADGWKVS